MLENEFNRLLLDEYFLELSYIHPEIKAMKSAEDLEGYIEKNFTEEQRSLSLSRASEKVIGGLLNTVKL